MSKPTLSRRSPPPPPLDKAAILAAVQLTRGGAVLSGEPDRGYIGVRPCAALPAEKAEVHRSLEAHYPKCKFAWLPERPAKATGKP